LKFELGTSVALLVANVGVIVLCLGGYLSLLELVLFLEVSFALAGYLGLVEAPASHRLLAEARTEMLDEIRIVKG